MSIEVVVTSQPDDKEMQDIIAFLNTSGVIVRILRNWGAYSVQIGEVIVLTEVDPDTAYPDVVIQYHGQFKAICLRTDFEDVTLHVASTILTSNQIGDWIEISNVKMYDTDGTLIENDSEEDEDDE